jgi:hypothetical protein
MSLDKDIMKHINYYNANDDRESISESEDPDFMDQVFNTEDSVKKLGYLFSESSLTCADQLYAITYTNGIFIWNLRTHDLIYRNQKKFNNYNDEEYDNDYFCDCFYSLF